MVFIVPIYYGFAKNYKDAFHEMDTIPNAQIIVMVSDAKVIGCAQFNFIRNLMYEGVLRGQS